ncbi:MAG: hypothetical protein J07HQW1_01778 [Haloquadratum walsbyi J07HQW1]|uniref:Uncharacterized protein n=1 Tax=Haloquadratum walsbyi J07HQW1 TaxID=1238424 RepID=U1MP96_9EURY|nr:MAG: hypothetical protein J07HQW1_01778 [Haloquadratum walsbyi J07HQW1]
METQQSEDWNQNLESESETLNADPIPRSWYEPRCWLVADLNTESTDS